VAARHYGDALLAEAAIALLLSYLCGVQVMNVLSRWRDERRRQPGSPELEGIIGFHIHPCGSAIFCKTVDVTIRSEERKTSPATEPGSVAGEA
jgi:hypothetical protein